MTRRQRSEYELKLRLRELETETRYVRIQCSATDRRTGEPREWHHVVSEARAESMANEIRRAHPDAKVEVVRSSTGANATGAES